MDQYILAIDAGGTKTLCIIASDTGQVIGWGRGGPVNRNFVADNVIVSSLADAVLAAFKMTGLKQIEARAGYVSAPGIDRAHVTKALAMVSGVVCQQLTFAGNDTISAFTGALVEPPGVVVLAGTGSFALLLDEHGVQRSVGGWGSLLGDEGSGYHIGLSALQRLSRAMDGRAPDTTLTKLLSARLSCETRPQLEKIVYKVGLTRQQIASLAKIVSEAADSGDQVAVDLLEKAAQELADLAIHLLSQTSQGSDYPVALTGGVANANRVLFDRFSQHIKAVFPHCSVAKGRFSPVIGAVLLALGQAGVSHSKQVLHNLDHFAWQEGFKC